MGTAKLVEQGASYSEGYMRYPNGFRQSAFPAICIVFKAIKRRFAIRMALGSPPFPFFSNPTTKVVQKREATK